MATQRVRRPNQFKELMAELHRENGGPFRTFKDLLVFCAALGYAKDRKLEFEESAEPVPLSVFSGPDDEAMMNMLAAVEEKELDILSERNLEARLRIFEKYGAGGLKVLDEELSQSTGTALETLIGLVQEYRQDEEDSEDDLHDLLEEIKVI